MKKEKLSGDEGRNKWSVVERRQLGRFKKKKSTEKTPQAIKWMFERMAVMIGVKSSVSLLPKNKGFEISFNVTESLLVRLPRQSVGCIIWFLHVCI